MHTAGVPSIFQSFGDDADVVGRREYPSIPFTMSPAFFHPGQTSTDAEAHDRHLAGFTAAGTRWRDSFAGHGGTVGAGLW
jgi:hypothetical protein